MGNRVRIEPSSHGFSHILQLRKLDALCFETVVQSIIGKQRGQSRDQGQGRLGFLPGQNGRIGGFQRSHCQVLHRLPAVERITVPLGNKDLIFRALFLLQHDRRGKVAVDRKPSILRHIVKPEALGFVCQQQHVRFTIVANHRDIFPVRVDIAECKGNCQGRAVVINVRKF